MEGRLRDRPALINPGLEAADCGSEVTLAGKEARDGSGVEEGSCRQVGTKSGLAHGSCVVDDLGPDDSTCRHHQCVASSAEAVDGVVAASPRGISMQQRDQAAVLLEKIRLMTLKMGQGDGGTR